MAMKLLAFELHAEIHVGPICCELHQRPQITLSKGFGHPVST
jgi:hypothetical protein